MNNNLFFLILFCLVCIEVWCKQACYPYIGCFPQEYPWVSPLRPIPPPVNPLTINMTITFYSRQYSNGQVIQVYPNIVFNVSGYSPAKRTVTITHGFASTSREGWVSSLTEVYLAQVDANIFVVDWGQGAVNVEYSQAIANIRIVGRILGRFCVYLIHATKNNPRNFHLIGHSLGAHTAGYAANFINNNSTNKKKVSRVTGLDPAQPGFQDFPKEVRLNKDIAEYVDVIHSNARLLTGVGYASDLGHTDFYLNNGYHQPNCVYKQFWKNINSPLDILNSTETSIAVTVTCSHERALHVYVASLDPRVKCKFVGHQILFRTPILSDQSSCGENGEDCIRLGNDTDKFKTGGAFQVMTSGAYPYCCNSYSVIEGCKT